MMTHTQSTSALDAYNIAKELQAYFVKKLNHVSKTFGENKKFEPVEWLRNHGENGGGVRYEAKDESVFNRASVNISHVHYDNDKSKNLGSASAISTIIHPKNPHVPSMHMHISWTEMKDGTGYWRIMGDLNPSIPNNEDKETFDKMLKGFSPELYEEASKQGDKYFHIPALNRQRGVSHYYLENYNSGERENDKKLAKKSGQEIINTYIKIITKAIENKSLVNSEDKQKQLDYHSLYLLQVLTLDRGTTSGLLVHTQNDVGIMGSIPSHVNKNILESWVKKMTKPQDELLRNLINVLAEGNPSLVDIEVKKQLASVVRNHYKKHPQALVLQASGNSVPPTVNNHK